MGEYQSADSACQTRWAPSHPGYAPGHQRHALRVGGWHPVADAAARIPELEKRLPLLAGMYLRAWRKDGTWARIHDTLRAQVRRKAGEHKHPTAGCLDSQSVKSTHIKGERGFDNGKKIKGRKRHLLVDTLGLMMAVLVTRADVSDPAGARLLLLWLSGACKKLRLIWVDGTYRGTLLDWVSARFGFRLQPVMRREDQKGFAVLPHRWLVERTFGWLNRCRRLSKDYEELPQTSETFVTLPMIRLMANRL